MNYDYSPELNTDWRLPNGKFPNVGCVYDYQGKIIGGTGDYPLSGQKVTEARRYVMVYGKKMRLCDVVRGDIFNLYEPDGELIGQYDALSNPYRNEANIWTIEVNARDLPPEPPAVGYTIIKEGGAGCLVFLLVPLLFLL